MIGKKINNKLVDLEYMVPKEHKLEAGVAADPYEEHAQTEVCEPAPEPTTQRFRELCYSCSKTSDEVALMPIFYLGSDRWLCPKCLKEKMQDEGPSIGSPYTSYSNDGYGTSNNDYGGSTSYDSGSDESDYSSPMSMFD